MSYTKLIETEDYRKEFRVKIVLDEEGIEKTLEILKETVGELKDERGCWCWLNDLIKIIEND